MFDTVRAYIQLDSHLDVNIFEGYRAVLDSTKGHETVRHWLNDGQRGDYAPRLDWYHDIAGAGILACTFSVSKMSGAPYDNPSRKEVERVLTSVDLWLHDTLGVQLPSMKTWTVTRVDYAWNFDVEDITQLRAYLLLVSQARCGGMTRHDYPDSGVVWKSGSRWVKFYDKALEVADGAEQRILRYEVSNLSAGVSYLCKRWLQCERIVDNVLTEQASMMVLNKYLQKFGLDNETVYQTDDYTLMRLKEVFGRSAMSAMTALQTISQHGTDTYKKELMSSSSFYRWRKRLYDEGFLPMSSVSSLSVLSLNSSSVGES